jgi:Tfp pilus assembly protein PilV
MMAMALMAIGLLTVALMQIHAMRDGSKGRHLSTAAMIAREQIEQMQRVPFSRIANKNFGEAEAWMAGVGLTRGIFSILVDQTDGTQAVEQVYTVDWRIGPTVPVNNDLKNIELAVTWQDKDSANPHTFSLATVVVNNKR